MAVQPTDDTKFVLLILPQGLSLTDIMLPFMIFCEGVNDIVIIDVAPTISELLVIWQLFSVDGS
jgi:hypothetical protein